MQLLINPEDVPLGAVVYLCPPGSDQPLTGPDGSRTLPVRPLLGGVPMRVKWYPWDSATNTHFAGFSNVMGGVRFQPVTAYAAEDAPVRLEYAVFVGGRPLTYEIYRDVCVKVAKTSDGEILSVEGYAHRLWLARFSLPPNAILVPTGVFDPDRDFDVIGCIGIPTPKPDERKRLEARGVEFFDHAPYKPKEYLSYVAIRLPSLWKVEKPGPWRNRRSLSLDIKDEAGDLVAIVLQEPHPKSDVWMGNISML